MNFVELDFEHIHRGNFARRVNDKLKELQRKFADFLCEHDVKSTAKMKITISLECDPGKDAERVAIYTDIDTVMPKDPRDRGVSNALMQVDAQSQQASLFAPEAGSTQDNPRQAVMEADGRPIE
jgi:hypothetical protein